MIISRSCGTCATERGHATEPHWSHSQPAQPTCHQQSNRLGAWSAIARSFVVSWWPPSVTRTRRSSRTISHCRSRPPERHGNTTRPGNT